jgi:hypothetical protein
MRKSACCAMAVPVIIYVVSVTALSPEPFDRVIAAGSISKLLCFWTADFKSSLK